MTTSYRLMLGDEVLPIDMRSVAADEAGTIIRVGDDGPIRFGFAYKGIAFSAQLIDDELGLRLRLAGEVGSLPAGEAASTLTDFAEAVTKRLGPIFHVNDRTLLLAGEIGLEEGLTAGNLLSGLAGFLAPLGPLIDLAVQRCARPS